MTDEDRVRKVKQQLEEALEACSETVEIQDGEPVIVRSCVATTPERAKELADMFDLAMRKVVVREVVREVVSEPAAAKKA